MQDCTAVLLKLQALAVKLFITGKEPPLTLEAMNAKTDAVLARCKMAAKDGHLCPVELRVIGKEFPTTFKVRVADGHGDVIFVKGRR